MIVLQIIQHKAVFMLQEWNKEGVGGGGGSGDKEGLPEDEECGPGLADGGEGSRQGRVGVPSLPLLHALYRCRPPAAPQVSPAEVSQLGHHACRSPVPPSTKVVPSLKSHQSFNAGLRFHLPLP